MASFFRLFLANLFAGFAHMFAARSVLAEYPVHAPEFPGGLKNTDCPGDIVVLLVESHQLDI